MPNYLPCRNPNCKLFGRPHPNCKDYENLDSNQLMSLESQGYELPGVYRGGRKKMAAGGMAEACPGCGDNYALGGPVIPQIHEDPSVTFAHAAAEHGLLGLFKNSGKAKLADPDKHHQTLRDLKSSYSSAQPDYASTAESMHNSPLAGPINKAGLSSVMERMHGPLVSSEENPHAFRAASDYFHSAIKGKANIDSHINKFIDNETLKPEDRSTDRDELKGYLDKFNQTPEEALNIGGPLGHYLPDQYSHLMASAGNAISYLNSIKPTSSQGGPLDPVAPPSKMAQAQYNRALDIANNPLSIITAAKSGTLQSQDMKTVSTIYPGLTKLLVQKATEALMVKDGSLTQKQRRGLSGLVGSPMSFVETPAAIQAIMQANSQPQRGQQAQQKPGKSSGKPTKLAVEQSDKQAQLSATDPQRREMEKRE